MSLRDRIYSVLALPAVYRLFGRAIRGDAYRIYMAEYVRPRGGERVLDIGCGPGDILRYLPVIDYLGFDINPKYIKAAEARFGTRGRFFCGDVGIAAFEERNGTFDLVLATGILHHLDDKRADRLFQMAHRALTPGGRLVTFDGCFEEGQSQFARFVVSRDRGEFVRCREEYLRLARQHFAKIEASVRHDLLRIPYTHLILQCVKQS